MPLHRRILTGSQSPRTPVPRATKPVERPTDDERELAGVVRVLAEEVRVLRQAVDELRETVQHGVRNLIGRPVPATTAEGAPAPLQVDAEQFEKAVQRLGDDVLERLSKREIVHVEAKALAGAMEDVEEVVYCCSQPKLTWYGAPDRPGIACENCGFPVAQEGNIVCSHDPGEQAVSPANTSPSPEPPRAPQGMLF